LASHSRRRTLNKNNMQINTVKKSGLNFLVNSSIFVPNSLNNSDYQAIQKWIAAGGIVEDEFTSSELLQNAKDLKLAQLNQNRNDFCLVPMEFSGNTFATTSEAKTAIISLANSLATLATTVGYPNYPEDDLISLTKANFKSIESLIQTREFTSRETRRDLKAQINAIVVNGEYFDDQEEPQSITPVEAVNAININF
jgi:hypothetical protein